MSDALATTRRVVAEARQGTDTLATSESTIGLAAALDGLAGAATDHGLLDEAAVALEEAAGLWASVDRVDQGAKALLLASITRRLQGQLAGARHDVERGLALPNLSPSMHIAFVMEQAEQALAGGDAATACSLFDRVVVEVTSTDAEAIVTRVRQRRAAARAAAGAWGAAADDLTWCSQAFDRHGDPESAIECMAGAAAIIAPHDPGVAEAVWFEADARLAVSEVAENASLRGRTAQIGSVIAATAGRWEDACDRADTARGVALGSLDGALYLESTASAVEASVQLGDVERAYARLASAWVTLEDLLGQGSGRALVRPQLEQLRARVGGTVFDAARAAHDARRMI